MATLRKVKISREEVWHKQPAATGVEKVMKKRQGTGYSHAAGLGFVSFYPSAAKNFFPSIITPISFIPLYLVLLILLF